MFLPDGKNPGLNLLWRFGAVTFKMAHKNRKAPPPITMIITARGGDVQNRAPRVTKIA